MDCPDIGHSLSHERGIIFMYTRQKVRRRKSPKGVWIKKAGRKRRKGWEAVAGAAALLAMVTGIYAFMEIVAQASPENPAVSPC